MNLSQLNLTEIRDQIALQSEFKPEYSSQIFSLVQNQISFDEFRNPISGKTQPVLHWCLECKKGAICGKCPSEQNHFNFSRKDRIQTFSTGLLLHIKVPSKELAGPIALQKNLPASTQRLVNKSLRIIEGSLDLERTDERMLLAAGPCKLAYCPDDPCSMLERGECRHPRESNEILECCGVNVFQTIENVGGKIHYIDGNTDPSTVPFGSRVGMVLYGGMGEQIIQCS